MKQLPHRQTRARRAYTLIELIVSMGAATMLMGGLASSIYLSSQALNGQSQGSRRTGATEILNGINADVGHAIRFTERTATAMTFEVPDRDGDSNTDTIRYRWTGAPNNNLEYTFNGGTPVVLAGDVQSFNLEYLTRFIPAGAAGGGGSPGIKVLLVVTSDTSPNAQELIRKAQMEAWGFVVTLIDDGDSQTNFNTAIASNDVAYVSKEVSDAALANKLRLAAIGVVNEHEFLVDEFGFSQNAGHPNNTQIDVLDDTHYLTSEFAVGLVTVFSSQQRQIEFTGTLSPDLSALAQSTEAIPMLGYLKPGDALYGGGTTPARRVQLPWAGDTFHISSLTSDGLTLMKRSIEWGSGLGDDGPQLPGNFGYENIFTVNTIDYGKDILATQVTLAEDGELNSITAYLDGVNGKKFEFAIYDDASGEPGSFIINSSSGSSGGTEWKSANVPPTVLTAGTYWLAFTLESNSYGFYRENTGGQTRIKLDHDAIKNGWPSTWSSTSSNTWKISIYGTYIPQ